MIISYKHQVTSKYVKCVPPLSHQAENNQQRNSNQMVPSNQNMDLGVGVSMIWSNGLASYPFFGFEHLLFFVTKKAREHTKEGESQISSYKVATLQTLKMHPKKDPLA